MLGPLAPVSQGILFPVTCLGLLAAAAVPARLGELVRPALVARLSPATLPGAVGTIVVERIFDFIGVVVLLALAGLAVPLPSWIVRGAVVLLVLMTALLVVIAVLIALDRAPARPLERWAGVLPDGWRERLLRLSGSFIEGLAVRANGRRAAALSVLVWLTGAAAIYPLFMAFHLDLPAAATVVVLTFVVIGVTIPTAPGLLGNWHYFCVLALTVFGVPKTEAAAFAVLYHFLVIAFLLLSGVAAAPLVMRSGSGPGQARHETAGQAAL